MITGFNTDIDFEGQTLHVQTEDKGLANPIIETLVYTGGQIVCVRKSSYEQFVVAGGCEEGVVMQLMEVQHRELIREIRDGALSKEDLQPFGWNVVSNRSFDQVVLGFLEDEVPLEKIQLAVTDPIDMRAGERALLRLIVTEETTERPIAGARVVVRLCAGDSVSELFSAATDARGRAEGACEIPGKPGSEAAVICSAEALGRTTELRCRVKRRRPSVQPA